MTFWENLPKPFFILAPMEDVTDVVFRRVVKKAARPDVFMTELYRNKRLEMVWSYLAKNREQMLNDSLYPCKKGTHKQYAGGLCGTLIELDGWEIKDDYPW